jgi:hypothetical protein
MTAGMPPFLISLLAFLLSRHPVEPAHQSRREVEPDDSKKAKFSSSIIPLRFVQLLHGMLLRFILTLIILLNCMYLKINYVFFG